MNIRTIASVAFSSITLVFVASSIDCGGETPSAQTAPAPQPTVAAATSAKPADSASVSVEADAGAPGDAAPAAAPEPQYTVLKKGLKATSALAADGFNVYWVEDAEGSVTRLSKKGGAMMMFYSSPSGGFDKPSSLVVDESNVYWTQHVKSAAAGGAPLGSVMMASKDGGSPTALAQNIRDELKSLALDAKNVYWLAGASVMRAAKAGGGASILAKLDAPTSVASDGKNVYWTSASGSVMRMFPNPGSKPETIAKDQDKPDNVLVDDASIFWTAGSKVMSMTKTTPTMKTLATSDGAIVDVAMDATHVYWVGVNASGDGVVMRAAKDGSAPAEKLASGQASPTGITVDKSAIYWATRGTEAGKYRDGALVMLPK